MKINNDEVPPEYRAYFAQFHSFCDMPCIREAVAWIHALNEKIHHLALDAFTTLNQTLKSVPVDLLINKVCEYGSNIERGFNIAAVVPFLGTLTSAMCITLAKIEFLAGAILASASESIYFVSVKFVANKELLSNLRTFSALGLELMIHGVLNIIRRCGELLLGTCTLGFGSVVLIIPNMINYRNFMPYFAYGTLINERIGEKKFPQEPTQDGSQKPPDPLQMANQVLIDPIDPVGFSKT